MAVCGTGTHRLPARLFSAPGAHRLGQGCPQPCARALRSGPGFASAPAWPGDVAAPPPRAVTPEASPRRSSPCGWSRTVDLVSIACGAHALGLGPTNPAPMSVAPEPLGLRRQGFAPCLALLMPAFALPRPPAVLAVRLHQGGTLPYHGRVSFRPRRRSRT